MITSCRTNDGSLRLKIDLLVWWRSSTSIGSGQHVSLATTSVEVFKTTWPLNKLELYPRIYNLVW